MSAAPGRPEQARTAGETEATPVRAPGGRWLQRELRWRLMLPVLAIAALSTLLSVYSAQYFVDRVFDRWLFDAARSLAEQVRVVDGVATVNLSAQAVAMLTYDIVDEAFYEVVDNGRHLAGQFGIPEQGTREQSDHAGARAYDGVFAGQAVRIARVPLMGPDSGIHVLAAETLLKRQRAQRDLLWTLAPGVLLVVAAALVVGAAVRSTLRPLEKIAQRWNERSQASLEPIPTFDVPRELVPFAFALNDLLARVRGMLERERQFAATAAHQLRTPLAGLRLGLARAAEAPDLATARGVLQELDGTTQRTARLIQQLLALSRLDPEVRKELDLVHVDLLSLARDVGETYLDAAQNKRIDIELRTSEADVDVLVHGHADLLSEALGNLIDNAIRYTPPGGRVVIAVHAQPPALEVSDSGPGIPADERDIVFERFVRGRATQGGGCGLGLPIVKEIAALHDAQVTLDDSALGGARLMLRFPQPDAAQRSGFGELPRDSAWPAGEAP
ncbi:MAG TPA: sensor histidine kinase N-terminal domain-containing protein [Pseudorhodoferax sp.]|jgi:two-component system sensor histidine kinase TctE|nr:sensor histidine kinase N-terminal domain-containing protein [Pseudorhodoferax sp.]